MKRAVSVLVAMFALSSVAVFAAGATKSDGWISDSMCGAKHMGTGAACVRSCIKNGMKPVFVDSSKKVWSIDNPAAVKNFYGDHVAVEATSNRANSSVHIDSVTAIK